MKRVRHLVAYDIADPRRLRAVHKKVQGFGDSLQYSVFVCDLTAAERARLVEGLADIIDPKADRIAVVTLGEGGSDSMFWFLGVKPSLPTSGSRIV
jgi:CRISPR-associated protein Cas2